MAVAPSMQSLVSAVPPYRGLQDYPGLAARSRDTTNAYVDERLHDISDPFRFMEADQAMQAGASPWAPFYQRLKEQGISGIRMPDYNPKRQAANDAAMAAQAFKQMPFDPTAQSFPQSVRSLYGDDGVTAGARQGRF